MFVKSRVNPLPLPLSVTVGTAVVPPPLAKSYPFPPITTSSDVALLP